MALGIWPQLYAESLADAGDVAEEIGKAQGGYYDVSKLVATVGNKWIGVPWAIGGGLVAYRKSWFDEIGHNTFPETWDALLDAGKKLKAVGYHQRHQQRRLDLHRSQTQTRSVSDRKGHADVEGHPARAHHVPAGTVAGGEIVRLFASSQPERPRLQH
jgi:hypothetical protein